MVELARIKLACSNCSLRELCMPPGVDAEELARIDELVSSRRTVKRREALYRNGDPFTAVYAIRTGTFKTSVATAHGRDQVTGFQMAGEILGLDGIASDRHTCDAVALEDSEVCVLPFERFSELAREVGALQQHLHRIMSREIVRDQGVMLLLGNMSAEERVAAFLLNLAGRLRLHGFSGTDMVLRMTRQEIGNYLGLNLETVSRIFSRFAQEQLLEVRRQHVRIVDMPRLQALLTGPGAP